MGSYACCSPSGEKPKSVSTLASLLKIVSEESRLKILCLLQDGEHCVCEILKEVKLSQSLVSHHLRDLKEIGVIKSDKRGLYVHYSLTEKGRRITKLLFQI